MYFSNPLLWTEILYPFKFHMLSMGHPIIIIISSSSSSSSSSSNGGGGKHYVWSGAFGIRKR